MTQKDFRDVGFRKALVGDYLKNARKKAGLTQMDVARLLRYTSAQFVSNWERGIALPPLDALPALCTTFGIDRTELLQVFLDYQHKVFAFREAELRKHLLS